MHKKDNCPNCGAPMTGDVCEYCGTTRRSSAPKTGPAHQTAQVIQKHKLGGLVVLTIVVGVLIAVSNIVNNIASRMEEEEKENEWETAAVVNESEMEPSNSIHISTSEETEGLLEAKVETTAEETTEAVVGGTRDDPIAFGTTHVFRDALYDYEVEVTVTEVIRGSEALNLVKSINRLNTDPSAGKEYMLAKVRVKGISSKNGEKITLLPFYHFECASQAGIGYDYKIVYNLEPEISDIYPGGETEGYLCYIVNEGDTLLIVFRGSGYGETAWFATQ